VRPDVAQDVYLASQFLDHALCKERLKMRSSRRIVVTLHFGIALFLLLALIALGISSAIAQQPASSPSAERERGIQLYKQGDAMGAIAALRAATKRNKNDISAWHYLGLSFEKTGKKDDARKAHEKAAKLGDDLLASRLEDTNNGNEFGHSLLPIRSQLVEAAESTDSYVALSGKLSKARAEEWALRAESLRGYADIIGSDGNVRVYSGKEVSTKARILSKPEPRYTEEARKDQLTGTIILRAIFAANGRVVGIRAVSSLPDGLTESAIRAARGIKFIPATKDGHPVSMFMQLEYNFNLY
jgi:TonB family protein